MSSTTDLATQNVLSYRADNLQVDTETVQQDLDGNGTVDFQRSFTREYDVLQRSTGYSLQSTTGIPAVNVPSSSPEVGIAYGFEPVAGRLGTVTSTSVGAAASSFSYAYDPARAGLISTLTGPAHTVTNSWEGEREVLDVKTNALLTAGVVSAYDYGVNSIGQRSSVATSGSAFTAAAGWAWGYDALGQVTSATHAADAALNQGYTYDDIGNRKQATLGDQPLSTTSYTPNLINQYSAITGANAPAAAPTYDTDGNQLSGASGAALGQTFVWDAENRLTAVKDASGAVLVSYVYDSKSRRVRRIEGSQTTLYVYHGWNCIAEYSLQTSSFILSKSYAWGLDLSGSVQGAGGVGGLLSVTHNAHSGAPTYFPTYDGNGNISEYLAATGSISAHFEYDAFGRVITSTGNTSDFDYRFSTKPQDAVTGWSYYGYRWYDAVSGRWPTRDPIEEHGGVSLHGMCYNNPVAWYDFLGRDPGTDFLDKVDPTRDKNYDDAKKDMLDKNSCIGGAAAGCGRNQPDLSSASICYTTQAEAEATAKSMKCKCDKPARTWALRSKPNGTPIQTSPDGKHQRPATHPGNKGPATGDKTGKPTFDARLIQGNQTTGISPTGPRDPDTNKVPWEPVDEPIDDWRDGTKDFTQEQFCATCPES